jgi:hypothetical protein
MLSRTLRPPRTPQNKTTQTTKQKQILQNRATTRAFGSNDGSFWACTHMETACSAKPQFGQPLASACCGKHKKGQEIPLRHLWPKSQCLVSRLCFLGPTTMEEQAPCWDLLSRPRSWWTKGRDGWDLFGFKVESGVDIFLNAFTGGSLIHARVDYPHSHHKGSFTSV